MTTEPTTETVEEPTESEQPAAELTEENDSEVNESDDAGDSEVNESDDAAPLAKVRREAASWRTKYRDAEKQLDTLNRELFQSRVKATGRLADATDMEYSPELVNDQDGMNEAIDKLLESKPHLKARTFGNVGQHDRREPEQISLGAILRNGA